MNKKNVVLVLIICCFLSIMAITIFGKEMTVNERVPVESLVIKDTFDEIITKEKESARREKIIEIEYSDDEISYFFSVSVLPENATNTEITYEIITGNRQVEITKLTHEEWVEHLPQEDNQDEENIEASEVNSCTNVHYFKIKFIEQDALTISFSSNKEEAIKTNYLMFLFTGTKHHDVID